MLLACSALALLTVQRPPEVSRRLDELSPEAVRNIMVQFDADRARLASLEQFRRDSVGLLVDVVGMGVCAGADMWATGHARSNPALRESNPLIGDSPEQHVAVKGGFVGLATLLDAGARAIGQPKLGRGFAALACGGFATAALWDVAHDTW